MTFEVTFNVQAQMWQTCKRCHRVQRFEFSLRDEEGWQRGALCTECFLEILEETFSWRWSATRLAAL